jgi:hypothetical protein
MKQWMGVPRVCELKGPRSRQVRRIDWAERTGPNEWGGL